MNTTYKYIEEKCERTKMNTFSAIDLIWIFTAGSVLGFILETVFCIVVHGRYENRSSLLFGPFNTVYGAGLLAMFLLSRLVHENKLARVFVFGAVVGTVIEFLCSWTQEAAFGTVSWDYTGMFLNIDGRVCLLFSVFWGALAVAWHKWLQQRVSNVFTKIPQRIKRPLAVLLMVVLALNAAISAAAIDRWQTRLDGAPAEHSLSQMLDRAFPDDYMEAVYANMRETEDN